MILDLRIAPNIIIESLFLTFTDQVPGVIKLMEKLYPSKSSGHQKVSETITVLLIAFSIINIKAYAQKQNYIIGPGDVIDIAFWQDPGLNSKVTVAEDSTITLSVGGTVIAGGFTTEQLAEKIVEQVSIFNRRITQASVTVAQYGSRAVFVMGNVSHPGKFTFEAIPNLWDVLSEAGGPTGQANLSNVMIMRNTNGEHQVLNIDLTEAIRNQALNSLPRIKPGDNIFVPAVFGGGNAGMQGIQSQENVLFIYGEVGSAGVYTFNKKLNLLEALISAGGPTMRAKLDEVAVIRKIGAYSNVTKVNVSRYAKESVPEIFMVKGGDTIFVPHKKDIRESLAWNFVMMAAGATVTAIVYNTIRRY